MSCCQAARPVPRYFYEHDEGIDGVVSSTVKIKVVAPIRYGLEDQSCLPSQMSFFSQLHNARVIAVPTVSFRSSSKKKIAEILPIG